MNQKLSALTLAALTFATSAADAAMVEYSISFTQVYKYVDSNAYLAGHISVDDSLLGAGHENQSVSVFPGSPLVSNFYVANSLPRVCCLGSLNPDIYSWIDPGNRARYSFKPAELTTNEIGELISVTGFLYFIQNPASHIELEFDGSGLGVPLGAPNVWVSEIATNAGRDGDSVIDAGGYYYLSRVGLTAVPLPATAFVLASALAGLGLIRRRAS